MYTASLATLRLLLHRMVLFRCVAKLHNYQVCWRQGLLLISERVIISRVSHWQLLLTSLIVRSARYQEVKPFARR